MAGVRVGCCLALEETLQRVCLDPRIAELAARLGCGRETLHLISTLLRDLTDRLKGRRLAGSGQALQAMDPVS